LTRLLALWLGRGLGLAQIPLHDREYLLGPAKRNDVLELWEVEQYGRDNFGDRDYVSLYGQRPSDWYARGVRLLARTAVECTRDRLADLIGRDVAAVAGKLPDSGAIVVDPFAGSVNTLHWIARHVDARSAIGFELDEAVFEATRRNVAILGLDVVLFNEPYETGLRRPCAVEDELVIVFVAPPWGDALHVSRGLDLRKTSPPVIEVVELAHRTFARHEIIVAVQLHERVVAESLAEVALRCDWSARTTYDVDPAGRNHGLLLATLGWTPSRVRP
jgi:hypothetical protein